MAKLPIDISGRRGLLERHQGDLNDTTTRPNLRYIGEDGQLADGILNPIKKYGYLSPANAKFATLSGTVAAGVNSIQYDAEGDIVYLSENGENILQLAGMDDTSLANYLSITAGDDIKDMLISEVNGYKSLVYVIDSNDEFERNPSTGYRSGGMYLGFKTIDPTEGIVPLESSLYSLTSNVSFIYSVVDEASVDWGANNARRLAQAFTADEIAGKVVSGVKLMLSREGGTGVGITMKVSIQANSTASTGAFTSRGAWSNAVTDYDENDTVTNGGYTWQCIKAHSAAAASGDEPGVGAGWEEWWNRFGAPSGTDLISQTFDLEDIDNYATSSASNTLDADRRTTIIFNSNLTLTPGDTYWIVIEEVGSVMTTGDKLSWLSTVNGTGAYDQQAKMYDTDTTPDHWKDLNPNGDTITANHDSFDFQIFSNRVDNLSQTDILGGFGEETGVESFLYLADNSLVYWFAGNRIHSFNGTPTGGPTGTAVEEALRFPAYTSIPDCAETRGRMYIAVQTSKRTSGSIIKNFTAERSGVFIWDRRSQVLGSTDFYPTPGAQEIKNLFLSSVGDVRAITVGNSGFCEIRGISGNQYAVLHTFEQNAFPSSRRGISVLNGMSVWLGQNGIFYAYGAVAPGEPEQLYKIGNMAAEANPGFVSGPIFVGNEYASGPQQAILFGWTDSDPSYVVQKWYPHGDGTISSVAQTGNQGNVYTAVKVFDSLVQVNFARIYCKPTTASASTTIATLKVYYNQSSTAAASKIITQKMASDGFIFIPLGKKSVHSIQFEIEFSTSETLGANDFNPRLIEVDFDPTEKKK